LNELTILLIDRQSDGEDWIWIIIAKLLADTTMNGRTSQFVATFWANVKFHDILSTKNGCMGI